MQPMSADTPKLVLVMVGLPARGKTYTARKLARYLTWHGYRAKVFNVGNYRRRLLGAHQDADFFSPDNPAGLRARQKMAEEALTDMTLWLTAQGDVAIFDATNTTAERRELVLGTVKPFGWDVVFVEIVCDDPEVIGANVRETKLSSPDYAGVDPKEAVDDFTRRIQQYESAYVPLERPDLSWIRLVDLGRQIVANRIQGYLEGRLVQLLMNLHTTPRPILMCRHGQSEYNAQGRIGGDSPLTPEGLAFGRRLGGWLDAHYDPDELTVWTSTLQRTCQTAAAARRSAKAWWALDEIDAGTCDGLTYSEIEHQHPEQYASRKLDKYRYRYPQGESYQDVISRLDPVLIELERQRKPVLVIAHQAVLRALYAYFMDIPPERCPFLDVPLHQVIELVPKAYGAQVTRHDLGEHA